MTTFSVDIKEAHAVDAGLLATIHADCFDEPWPEPDFARFLEDSHFLCLAAVSGQNMIGFLLCRLVMEEAEIITFGVLQGFRRRGVAGGLLAAMRQRLKQDGIERWFLEVSEANPAAIALYRNAAFKEVGKRSNYYTHPAQPGTDALVMQCDL